MHNAAFNGDEAVLEALFRMGAKDDVKDVRRIYFFFFFPNLNHLTII